MYQTELCKEKQPPLPVGSSLLLSGSGSRVHVLQHILIIGGSGTGYDGMADLVTDGTLRRPRGCLLTGHTHYTKTLLSSASALDSMTTHSVRASSLICVSLIRLLGYLADFFIYLYRHYERNVTALNPG